MLNKARIFVVKNREPILLISGAILLLILYPVVNKPEFTDWFKSLFIVAPSLYNPANPPIFFSIGEALSAIAILFAVYQFKKEKWNLALKIRKYIEPVILVSIILGVFFSIISSLLIFQQPTNVFQLSIFWQVLSSLLIGFSVIFLLLKARNINLFNEKTCRRFYDVLSQEIARPSEERLNLALNVLLDNFENICKSVVGSSPTSDMSKCARSALNVFLSDRSMANLLVTKRLDGLMYIFAIAEKYNIHRRHSSSGIPLLVQSLFYNPESFLYKHLENSGLALSSNLYEGLFESPILLNNFDLFGYPTIGYSARGSTSSLTVDVFIQAVSRSIKTYLKNGKVPARQINNGISHLSRIFGELCSQIKAEQDAGQNTRYDLDGKWWSLHKIANFFGHDYLFIGHDEVLDSRVVEIEKTCQEANFNSTLAINEGVAAFLYKSFEQLYQIEKGTDTYHTVLELLHGINFESSLKEGYSAPFKKRMWQQIATNLVKHHYPVTLKSYLHYIGFSLIRDDEQPVGSAGEEAERMRRLLYIDLKPQIDNDEKMADGTSMKEALIPDSMDYKDGKFTYTMGFGRGPTKEIAPPPEGSTSALEGIDLENVRFID